MAFRSLQSLFKFHFMYGYFVCVCICVPHVRMVPVQATMVPVLDGYKPCCGCWELNLSPLKEQPVLLAVEPSTQSFLAIALWDEVQGLRHRLPATLDSLTLTLPYSSLSSWEAGE